MRRRKYLTVDSIERSTKRFVLQLLLWQVAHRDGCEFRVNDEDPLQTGWFLPSAAPSPRRGRKLDHAVRAMAVWTGRAVTEIWMGERHFGVRA